MSTTLNFADRFSYPQPDGISPTVSATAAAGLTEAQIIAAAPQLVDMAGMVRRYSVLLSRRTTLEIFKIITSEADPRIALILASARRKTDNNYLFQGLNQVKEVMYADSARELSGITNRTLFSDGIRRVAAALTASVLIGQLAQIPEQAEHANTIEKQALADLDRVCTTYELSQSASDANNNDDKADTSFVFEATDVSLVTGEQLAVSWYSVGLTDAWVSSGNYTTSTSAWRVVADLAESINSLSLVYELESLVAVARLAGSVSELPEVHTLSFYPRTPTKGVIAFSLSIRIEKKVSGIPTGESPVRWGLTWNTISNKVLNGSILILKDNKSSSSTSEKHVAPTVLYIRNKITYDAIAPVPAANSKLKFRTQFWTPQDVPTSDFTEITIARVIKTDLIEQQEADRLRFSQIAAALLQAVSIKRNNSGLTGAIIRNDPLSIITPVAGVELIAWTLSRFNTHVVLDILEMPSDIEIATGNLVSPHTLFSSNPKSIRTECTVLGGSSLLNTGGLGSTQPLLSKSSKKSLTLQKINDEVSMLDQRTWI
jgi:hypothetical protein